MKRTIATLSVLALSLSCFPVISFAESPSEAPSLEIESSLHGTAYTNGKSTLKGHLNTTVTYDSDSQAVFTLAFADGSEIDDSKIDCSGASVILDEGDGYYPSEYVFSAETLEGEWNDGQFTYTLSEGDFEINRDDYPQTDTDSGREWSCLGGDGAGHYHFNLTVSGIVYDGQEVESQTFPLDITIYGYNYTSDAESLYGETGVSVTPEFASLADKSGASAEAETEPVWTWIGDGEQPILCDQLQDDFYVTWPDGTDASTLSAEDVTITLASGYGETRELVPDQDYYVSSSAQETQIALTYINWEFIPVYRTMTIQVAGENAEAEMTYDIGSVYVYEAQQGGGGDSTENVVTAYSFYGFENLESWEQIMKPAATVLACETDGVTMYYAEDADGNGSLTENVEEAYTIDASGEEDRNQQLAGNSVYITRKDTSDTVEKTIDGETVTFTQQSIGGGLLSPSECDPSLTAAPGYVIPWGTENWITNEKWAWQKGVETGWTGISVTPYEGKFEWSVEVGTSCQFEADAENVTWEIYGDVDEGTSVTQDGLVTVAETESHASFAVTVTDADGNHGTVTVKVAQPE